MDDPFKTQKNIKVSHQQNSVAWLGPVIGALAGITLFALVYFLSIALGSEILPIALTAPGILVHFTIGSVSTSDVFDNAIFLGISSIPYAVLGALFGSRNKWLFLMGIGLFIMFCTVAIIITLGLLAVFGSDY